MCRTKEATGRGKQRQSHRGTKLKKKVKKRRYTENWKKGKKAWSTAEVREKDYVGRQGSREGRGPTEETQRCRNNRGIKREARIKLRGKKQLEADEEGKWKEKGLTRKDSDEGVKAKGKRDSVRPYVRTTGARISHLHRNKLAGTIGSSVHSDTANTVQPCSPNRKPLQYAPLTLSTQQGPIDLTLSFVCRTIILYLVTFS